MPVGAVEQLCAVVSVALGLHEGASLLVERTGDATGQDGCLTRGRADSGNDLAYDLLRLLLDRSSAV
jgi:hypothetical protein